MYYFTWYLVFGFLPYAYSASKCPDVKPVNNFNITAFIGKSWYQIARYNDDFEMDGDCTIMSFNIIKGVLLFNIRSTLQSKIRNFGGSIDFKDSQNGVLYYHSKAFGGETDNTIPVIMLDIDYNSYAVLYFCTYETATKTKTEMAWIVSTTKTLSDTAKAAIEELFHSKNILDRSKFLWETFTNAACKENV